MRPDCRKQKKITVFCVSEIKLFLTFAAKTETLWNIHTITSITMSIITSITMSTIITIITTSM